MQSLVLIMRCYITYEFKRKWRYESQSVIMKVNDENFPLPPSKEALDSDDFTKWHLTSNAFNLVRHSSGLSNYYFYRSGFDSSWIERLMQHIPPVLQDGNVSGTIDHSYRNSRIHWIPKNKDTMWLYEKLAWFIKDANKSMWNFDISNFFEDIQYTEYDASYEGKYEWHVDVGDNTTSTRKISVSIQLSDESEYEGGDLQFHINRSIVTAPKGKGDVVLFPSYLLHQVKPVTRGRRKALIMWMHGPAFR